MEIKEGLITLGDPLKVGEYMQILGVTNDDLNDSFRFQRFQEIVKFLDTVPDPHFFIYKAVGSKQIDRLDFIHEYMHFHQEKAFYEKEMKDVEEKIAQYNRDDLNEIERMTLNEFVVNKLDLETKIDQLKNEIKIYEN